MTFTLVSFHAHPDDEALLTGGTLARTVAEGHRVVIVTATDGGAGLTSADVRARSADAGGLGGARIQELYASAAALGVHRVVLLGYVDGGFADAGISGPAAELAEVLESEEAHVLTGYDARGGYGHPDHVHVHRVARRAAYLAQTPVLLEATVDRRLLRRAARLAAHLPGTPAIDLALLDRAYTDRAGITHEVDVRRYVDQKVAALSAHYSQAVGGTGDRRGGGRTVGMLSRLPSAITGVVLGREWFTDPSRVQAGGTRVDDVFSALR